MSNSRQNFRSGVLTASILLLAPLGGIVSAPRSAQAQTMTAAKQTAAAGEYGVDKAHSDIGFTVVHLAVSKVRGHFSDFDSAVTVDGKNIAKSSVEFTIKAASIDTGVDARNNHLKSADFFDAEKYPDITFKSTRISKRKDGYAAIGNLTIKNVTKAVVLPFTVAGPVKGPDGKLHLGVDTQLNIDRTEYGLTWNKVVEGTAMVGNDIAVTISLDLAKK
jgi:polyisoprenoid-binding protein YceI